MTAWGKDGGLKSFEQVLSTALHVPLNTIWNDAFDFFLFFVFSPAPGERRLPPPGSVLRAKRTVDAHVQNETSTGQVVLCSANRRHVHQVEVITADDGDSTTRVRTKSLVVNKPKKTKQKLLLFSWVRPIVYEPRRERRRINIIVRERI